MKLVAGHFQVRGLDKVEIVLDIVPEAPVEYALASLALRQILISLFFAHLVRGHVSHG